MADPITLPDLTAYTDDDLNGLRDALDAETARRTRLATIPVQVGQLTAQYVDAGGSRTDLTAAVNAG